MSGRIDPRTGSAGASIGGRGGIGSIEGQGRGDGSYYDDGSLYIEDEHVGVNRGSLRKSRKYLFIGVFGLVASIAAFVLYFILYQNGITANQYACWSHQVQVEQLAQQYVTTNGFTSLPAYVDDIPTFSDIYMECPDGGSYTWNPVTGIYYCSEHQHYPDGFGDAQSITLGTSTTTVNAS